MSTINGFKLKKNPQLLLCIINRLFPDQCLDLGKANADDEPVKGQIIISLLSRDGPCGGTPLAIVGPLGDLRGPTDLENSSTTAPTELPSGWEERRTPNGRLYYVNHITKSTQWIRPPASIKTKPNRSRINNNNTTFNVDNNNLEANRLVMAVIFFKYTY